jgi:hypothetical protein
MGFFIYFLGFLHDPRVRVVAGSIGLVDRLTLNFNGKKIKIDMKEIIEKILTDADARQSDTFKEAVLTRSALNPWDDVS